MADRELAAWLLLTRRLPALPRALGLANHVARRSWLRQPRQPVRTRALGLDLELDAVDLVEGLLLFAPQLYDRRERRFLLDNLRPGEAFADIGAHVGLYALLAARQVGPAGRVLAIEPDARSRERLSRHVAWNGASQVRIEARAASDHAGMAMLGLGPSENRGASSLLDRGAAGIEVETAPLATLLRDAGIDALAAAKLDVEGLEYRILAEYFQTAPSEAWPRALVVEHHPSRTLAAGGDVLLLLKSRGYTITGGSRHNHLAWRAGASPPR